MVESFAKGVTFEKENSAVGKGPVTISRIYLEMLYTVETSVRNIRILF